MHHGEDEHTPKRIKLERPEPSAHVEPGPTVHDEKGMGHADEAMRVDEDDLKRAPEDEEDADDNCSICLHTFDDRTVIPSCSHEFCFECLMVWTAQSRRCPLCNQPTGDYLIHSIRSRYDYRKHHLPPLRRSPPPAQEAHPVVQARRDERRRRRERERNRRRQEELSEVDKFDRSLAKRRWVYQHDLYAKHVASNSYTKFRPYPTPAVFAASSDLISRTSTFLRRELQVWEGLDVEFLTTLIISLMKSIDIRSESAVKLLSEFLDLDAPYAPGRRHANAEHFAHEVYCYVRSPYKDLYIYDSVVQYDTPPGVQTPVETDRRRRWDQSRSPSPSGPSRTDDSTVDQPGHEQWSFHHSPDSPAWVRTPPPHIHTSSSERRTSRRDLSDVLPLPNPRTTAPTSSEIAGVEEPGVDVVFSDLPPTDIDAAPRRISDRKGKGKAVDHEPRPARGVVQSGPSHDMRTDNDRESAGEPHDASKHRSGKAKSLLAEDSRPPRDILSSIQSYLTDGRLRPNGQALQNPTRSSGLPRVSPWESVTPVTEEVAKLSVETDPACGAQEASVDVLDVPPPSPDSSHIFKASSQPEAADTRTFPDGSGACETSTPNLLDSAQLPANTNGGPSRHTFLSGSAEAPEREKSHMLASNSKREYHLTSSAVGIRSISHQNEGYFGGDGRCVKPTLAEKLRREKQMALEQMGRSADAWSGEMTGTASDGSGTPSRDSCDPHPLSPDLKALGEAPASEPTSSLSSSSRRERLLMRLQEEKKLGARAP